MDKDTVEANDLKFREKLKELRVNLADRQRSVKRNNRSGLAAKIVVPVLVIAAAAYFLAQGSMKSRRLDAPELAKNSPAPSLQPEKARKKKIAEKNIAKTEESEVAQTTRRLSALSFTKKRAGENAPSWESKPDINSESGHEIPVLARPIADKSETVKPPKKDSIAKNKDYYSSLPPKGPEAARPLETGSAGSFVQEKVPGPARPLAKSPVAQIPRITRKYTCLGVKGRECVVPRTVFRFSEKPTPSPHFWMEVYSESLPHVLKHVYFHDGQKYCEVPLEIKYPRTRTWSNITLADPSYIGKWRVEIVDENGSVLGETVFEVASESGLN